MMLRTFWTYKLVRRRLPGVATAILILIAVLGLSRVLYEWAFPQLLWLGRPGAVLPLALALAALVAAWLSGSGRRRSIQIGPPISLALLPLLLNIFSLVDPAVDLVQSRLILIAAFWLTVLLLALRHRGRDLSGDRWRRLDVLLLIMALLPVYLLTMPDTVGRADTFEFQVVVPRLGIAHPTGYPLYLLLGRLFAAIPLKSVAWRLNLASVVFALLATAVLFRLGFESYRRIGPALLGAVALGLTPTFWSQAIEAEVYALHAVIIATALWLMVRIGGWQLAFLPGESEDFLPAADDRHHVTRVAPGGLVPLLALVLGLGLTNHLTSLFLLPPAILTLWLARNRLRPREAALHLGLRQLVLSTLAFVLPLLLYAYLPLRWQAVNGEPMGFGRFVDWILGGRFQGALQWDAWLNDASRYEIIGRLFLENWGWLNLVLAGLGFLALLRRCRPLALVLATTWLGFTFYSLNYHVPDLAVFLLPAQMVIALSWMSGGAALLSALAAGGRNDPGGAAPVLLLLLVIPTLLRTPDHWSRLDRSSADDLTQWGQGVLAQPLAPGAAILADSEKIAPLYYLQQAEGIRPDLDIMVLPDEAAYRAELERRLVLGQSVYLARFLPGLEAGYHLRSVGPLTEVSRQPLRRLPETAVSTDLRVSALKLAGYFLEPVAAIDDSATALTLYWQAEEALPADLRIYTRWTGPDLAGAPVTAAGQHPANNYYPTYAWEPDEIVPDFHLIPHPRGRPKVIMTLEVAAGPPFAPAETLSWQPVESVALPVSSGDRLAEPVRMIVGQVALDGVDFPRRVRPRTPLQVLFTGSGWDEVGVQFRLAAIDQVRNQTLSSRLLVPDMAPVMRQLQQAVVETSLDNGRYGLTVEAMRPQGAICGWFQPVSRSCTLGEVEITGVPLPVGAINFDDKFALLGVNVDENRLQPGGRLSVGLTWQSLAPVDQDYTVFVQVVDAQDRLVGQVDAWPVQGTYPTSQWSAGEQVADPYLIQLAPDLPAGAYRLLVGWYLLGDLRRLPIMDTAGQPVDDKHIVDGLVVP